MAIATVAATIVAVALAILVTRPAGAEFLPLSRSLVNIGQTFPPVAVLALAVPVVGFGDGADADRAVPLRPAADLRERADRPDDTARQCDRGGARRRHDRLAAAVPGRTAARAAADPRRHPAVGGDHLGTATIGSTVAAKTLGEVIIAGLMSNNLAFILQGGLIVAALAVLIYDGLSAIERYTARRMGQETG